jgi:phage tail protein X
MASADPVSFAAAARRLAAEARRRGLAVPGFRSPPRLPGVDRTIRHRPDGASVIAVRVHGRSIEAVVTDMVEGVLAANPSTSAEGPETRQALLAAVLGDEEASAA